MSMVSDLMVKVECLYDCFQDFLANVEAEVRHQVRKLSHHPSIVLWSGNNENQVWLEIPNLLVQTLTTSELFVQGIAQGNDALLIDYSVLYDQTVRATLWVEVRLSVFSLCSSSYWSLSVHLSVFLSVCLYICRSVCPSIHLPLSICLSPFLSPCI